MRFRLLELFLVLTVAGGALAALRASTLLAEILFVNFTYGFVLLAIVLAIGRTQSRRAFWCGFLVASIGYLAFALVPDEFEVSPRMEGPELTTRISMWILKSTDSELYNEAFEGSSYPAGPFCVSETGLSLLQEGGGFGSQSYEFSGPSNKTVADFSELIELIQETVGDDFSNTGSLAFVQNISGKVGTQPAQPGSIYYRSGYSFMNIGHSVWALLLGWIVGHASQFVYERSRETSGQKSQSSAAS